jgi:hypothetical protein
LQATFSHYRAVVTSRDTQVTAIETDLAEAATRPPFADAVARLAAYRGVGQLGALALAAEVGDWRGFAHAAAFMAFTGLVACERSSADSVWRGHITRTGSKHLRFQLVESAWSYHHRPLIGGALHQRQQHVDPDTLARSWTAQLRLCRRFRQLERRKHITGVAVVAVARELAGFLWSVTALANPRTRRSTADAGKIPATLRPRRGRRDASSLGLRPAQSRLAVPTREHQSGGPPIHAAPTRSWPTSARPPPGPPAQQGNTRSCSPAASHSTAPFHIRRSSASATASATSPTTAYGCCSLRRQLTHRTARRRGHSPRSAAKSPRASA